MRMHVGTAAVSILRGDITRQDTEAIVNAANASLMGGGGVDGAIHRAGGPAILRECREIVARRGPCGTGEAVLTTGGNLPVHHVIHTVGPVWHGGGHGERELLARCYASCLHVAKEHGIRSLSFPSISTGAYGFPIELAAPLALGTVRAGAADAGIEEIRFVLYSESDLAVYLRAWECSADLQGSAQRPTAGRNPGVEVRHDLI